MSIAVILVALVAAFLAWRFIAGALKFGVLLVILAAVAFYLLGGGAS